ncbi:MAG: hypothetical protein LUO93_03195 [Methanomicrobiales archaeon]|nr:hypothetical protein [Methanomicrobiales archaeon]
MTVKWGHLALFLLLLVGVGSAAEGDPVPPGSSLSLDYFLIFVVGLVLLNLFVFGLRGIFRRKAPERKRSRGVVALGSLIALLFIAFGSLFFITAVLVILAAGAGMTVFVWLSDYVLYHTGSVSMGILGIGVAGVAAFLIGVYVLVAVQGPSMKTSIGSPTKTGQLSDEDHAHEVEALNPTLTLRVSGRMDGKPAANARVILKQTNGTKFYTKTTNIEGEVTFDNIAGYSSDYHAYVDGDEERQKFRVALKKSSS